MTVRSSLGQKQAAYIRLISLVQVSQAASYLSLGTYAFASTMEGFMSSTLSLNASHIAITDLGVEPGSVISQASQTVKLRVDLTATPSADNTAAMVCQSCRPAPAQCAWYLRVLIQTLQRQGFSDTTLLHRARGSECDFVRGWQKRRKLLSRMCRAET